MFVGFSPLKTGKKNIRSTNVKKIKKQKRVSFEPLSNIEGDPNSKVPKIQIIDDSSDDETANPDTPTFDVLLIDSEGTPKKLFLSIRLTK